MNRLVLVKDYQSLPQWCGVQRECGGLETMSEDILSWWVVILTVFFIVESSLLVYFVRWVLWRCNTVITELMIEKKKGEP